jgi:SAM-dependent methyltransferase
MQDRDAVERRYAEFYRLYVKDFRQDIPVYRELAAKAGGSVLEVGCRTGRVTAHLAAAGHQVLGIDTSRPLLEQAVEQTRPWAHRARVADHDLRHHPTPEQYSVGLVTLFSFNDLIDVEEQRLFLRHLQQSVASPGIVALDLFCPLSLARPDEVGECREITRVVEDREIVVRDQREMLTPLLERRTQEFRVGDGPTSSYATHRRYITPQHAGSLLTEAGFENVRWLEDYDLATLRPIDDDARPQGPFLVIAQQ